LTQRLLAGGNFADGSSPGTYSLRLAQDLSDVAKQGNPVLALANSARSFYRASIENDDDKSIYYIIMGNAFADLAVTGRNAYEIFVQKQTKLGSGQTRLKDELDLWLTNASWWGSDWNALNSVKVNDSVKTALARAYAVVWALRAPTVQDRSRCR